jgi:spore coat polysaccharide biosynthesis protein SpsF
MKIVAIIQARMTSKRLPKKVLLPINGLSVLEHVYSRLNKCKTLNEIIVATSTNISDDKIEHLCKLKNIKVFRGSLNDVLDRYYRCAKFYKADAIVRITADCPLIDPEIVDEVVKGFLSNDYDFYSLIGSFPDGLDCQVFSFKALKKSWIEAKLRSDREHVGTYIEKTRSSSFHSGGLEKFKNFGHYRWTLDRIEDYHFLKKIFDKLFTKNRNFKSNDVIQLLKREPELLKINSNIIRNEGYLKSLKGDRL